MEVEQLGLELDRVARSARDDHAGPERLAQARDVALEDHLDRLGSLIAPQLIDESVGCDHLVRVQEQEREHGPLLGSAKGKHGSVVPCLERSKDPELHASAGR